MALELLIYRNIAERNSTYTREEVAEYLLEVHNIT